VPCAPAPKVREGKIRWALKINGSECILSMVRPELVVQRIKGFFKRYALYKSMFYLLTYLLAIQRENFKMSRQHSLPRGTIQKVANKRTIYEKPMSLEIR